MQQLLSAILAVHLASAPVMATLGTAHVQAFRDSGITVTEDGEFWKIVSTGVPNHEYGPFPSEGNPNTLVAAEVSYNIRKVPVVASEPGCLGMGPIGITKNGIPMFNPYNAVGYNAVEGEYAEVFDDCNGHPQNTGVYHYHQIPNCIYKHTEDEFMGVALDGYPIYGPLTTGKNLTTADLDKCHGQTRNGAYEYRITYDFPYVLGCYKGEVEQRGGYGNGTNMGPPPGGDRPPPTDGDRPPPPDGDRPPPPGGDRPPPLDGDRPPPPDGGMSWSSCYATCENPALGDCEEEGSPVSGSEEEDGGGDPSAGSIVGASLLTTAALVFVARTV